MAATARAFILSRVTDLSSKQTTSTTTPLSCFLRRPSLVAAASHSAVATVSCLSSGGGVSDDFVSTRKSNFDRGFSVISKMLKRIEPLDNSVISKGVSDAAKDSMKQTISTMLGLLPSDQFSVTVRVSRQPLDRLLVSAIITGYTLWNAEYRMSLTKNLDISMEDWKEKVNYVKEEKQSRESEVSEGGGGGDVGLEDLEISPQNLGDLSPEAFSYIQQLQTELSDLKEELIAQRKDTIKMEYEQGNRNDLLEYLRSLDANMVMELSRPSSTEVEDVIHQLVQSILQRFFKDEPTLCLKRDSVVISEQNQRDAADEFCSSVGTSRDYLAKLLFWCMLLGHHLRGLENRLHLSCVVGLL